MNQADDVTLTYALFTWPWNRRYARRIELIGRKHGLKVTHEHDGGWTLRYHLIVAVGENSRVLAFSDVLGRFQRLSSGFPVYSRREKRDLWERLADRLSNQPSTLEEDPCP